jgi:hypothetical protein
VKIEIVVREFLFPPLNILYAVIKADFNIPLHESVNLHSDGYAVRCRRLSDLRVRRFVIFKCNLRKR